MALISLAVCVDEHSRGILEPLLHNAGMPDEVCSDLVQAASLLASKTFDIIVLDFSQQQAESLQFVANIRKTTHNKKTQILALVDSSNEVRSLFSAGCNFVLYKPLSVEAAQDCLRAARGLMRREKRSNKRIRLNNKAAIAYSSVENALATLLDLSEGGVRIQSERGVPVNSKVYFQFTLPGQNFPVRISAEVVWQDSLGRVGLRFADVPQTSRKVMNEWLRANSIVEPDAALLEESSTKRFGLGLLKASVSDRRIKTRHACQLSAQLYREESTVPHHCTLSDISADGCYVESTSPFAVGTQMKIVVRTKNMKLEIAAKVQTMHPGFGMGAEFTAKTPEQKNLVKQLIHCAATWEMPV